MPHDHDALTEPDDDLSAAARGLGDQFLSEDATPEDQSAEEPPEPAADAPGGSFDQTRYSFAPDNYFQTPDRTGPGLFATPSDVVFDLDDLGTETTFYREAPPQAITPEQTFSLDTRTSTGDPVIDGVVDWYFSQATASVARRDPATNDWVPFVGLVGRTRPQADPSQPTPDWDRLFPELLTNLSEDQRGPAGWSESLGIEFDTDLQIVIQQQPLILIPPSEEPFDWNALAGDIRVQFDVFAPVGDDGEYRIEIPNPLEQQRWQAIGTVNYLGDPGAASGPVAGTVGWDAAKTIELDGNAPPLEYDPHSEHWQTFDLTTRALRDALSDDPGFTPTRWRSGGRFDFLSTDTEVSDPSVWPATPTSTTSVDEAVDGYFHQASAALAWWEPRTDEWVNLAGLVGRTTPQVDPGQAAPEWDRLLPELVAHLRDDRSASQAWWAALAADTDTHFRMTIQQEQLIAIPPSDVASDWDALADGVQVQFELIAPDSDGSTEEPQPVGEQRWRTIGTVNYLGDAGAITGRVEGAVGWQATKTIELAGSATSLESLEQWSVLEGADARLMEAILTGLDGPADLPQTERPASSIFGAIDRELAAEEGAGAEEAAPSDDLPSESPATSIFGAIDRELAADGDSTEGPGHVEPPEAGETITVVIDSDGSTPEPTLPFDVAHQDGVPAALALGDVEVDVEPDPEPSEWTVTRGGGAKPIVVPTATEDEASPPAAEEPSSGTPFDDRPIAAGNPDGETTTVIIDPNPDAEPDEVDPDRNPITDMAFPDGLHEDFRRFPDPPPPVPPENSALDALEEESGRGPTSPFQAIDLELEAEREAEKQTERRGGIPIWVWPAVAIAIIAIGGFFAFGGGGDDDPEAGVSGGVATAAVPTATAPAAAPEVTATAEPTATPRPQLTPGVAQIPTLRICPDGSSFSGLEQPDGTFLDAETNEPRVCPPPPN